MRTKSHHNSDGKQSEAKHEPIRNDQTLQPLEIFEIQSTTNGLVDPDVDKTKTASVDIMIMALVERCYYRRTEDTIAYLRQKPFPENYPGVGCVYCAQSKGEKKQWFFNSSLQLATGLPKIEQHLMTCYNAPKNIKSDISRAKHQEERERAILRMKTNDKITRRQYSTIVFERLGAEPL